MNLNLPLEASWPVTRAQQGIWLGQTLAGVSRLYWTAEALVFDENVDVERLANAIRRAVLSCASLFCTYHEREGSLVLEHHRAETELLECVDLKHEGWQDWVKREPLPVPELDRGPLFRSVLLRGSRVCVWYMRAHHIALDGFGFHLLQSRVALNYTGPSPCAALGEDLAQLRQIALDELKYTASDATLRDRAYFGFAALASGGLRQNVRPCAQVLTAIQEDALALLEGAERAAQRLGVEVVSLLLAKTAVFHARLSRARIFRLGLASAARHTSALLRTPCMAMNILPVVVRLDSTTTWVNLCLDLDTQLKALRRHQRYRYEDLRRDFEAMGDNQPLFAGVLNYMPFSPVDFGTCRVSKVPVSAGPVEPWALTVHRSATVGRVSLAWDGSEVEQSTCETRLFDFIHDPDTQFWTADGQLEPPADRRVLDLIEAVRAGSPELAIVHGPSLIQSVDDVLELIERQAQHRPGAVALVDGVESLSYHRLVGAIGHLAQALEARGIGPGVLVALHVRRSMAAILGQLAVMSLGAAFLPLDPDAPRARVAQVLQDSQVRWVLRDAEPLEETAALGTEQVELGQWVIDALGAGEGLARAGEPSLRSREMERAAPAYVIYTSGSTGRPRGVEVSRGALSHFVCAAQSVYGWTSSDRILQFASLQFDASIEEIYGTLAVGATLVLRDEASLTSLEAFRAFVERSDIHVLDLPTAFFHELCSARMCLPKCVRTLIIGGEAAQSEAVASFVQRHGEVRLFNSYGPTETTVVCCAIQLRGDDSGPPPLGRPLPGLSIVLLDQALRPCRVGQDGQLGVLGPTLANGYFYRGEDTAQRFVTICIEGRPQRVYLTGDWARLGQDGRLTFLGRKDDELKINGQRVRLLDIEQALLGHPQVQEVAVVAGKSGHGHFIAHYVSAGPVEEAELQAQVRALLPAVATPRYYVHHATLPRDRNGKIDRRGLSQARAAVTPAFDGVALAPLGNRVLSLFRTLLNDADLQADDDLFARGTHSLLALRAAHQLSVLTGRSVSVGQLYAHRTARSLVAALDRGDFSVTRGVLADDTATLLPLSEGQGPPLFCIYPVDGAALCYAPLTAHLPGVHIVGVQSPLLKRVAGVTPGSSPGFDELVEHAWQHIQAHHPSGPYRLLGWSSGGAIAQAVAANIERAGGKVELLALLDSQPSCRWAHSPAPELADALMMLLDDHDARFVESLDIAPHVELLIERIRGPKSSLAHLSLEEIMERAEVAKQHMLAYRAAEHPTFSGDAIYFRAGRGLDASGACPFAAFITGNTEIIEVEATHLTMCGHAALGTIAAHLKARRLV